MNAESNFLQAKPYKFLQYYSTIRERPWYYAGASFFLLINYSFLSRFTSG